MAIAIIAVTMVVRIFSPHYLLKREDVPIVPALTGLVLFATLVGILRRKIKFRLTTLTWVQWIFWLWGGITRVIHAGLGSFAYMFSCEFFKELVFVSTVAINIDNEKRYKIFIWAMAVGLAMVSFFAVPQVWSPKECAEIEEGVMLNHFFVGRPCSHEGDCFAQPLPPRHFTSEVGDAVYVCERKGPFGVPAQTGRTNWVGFLREVDAFGASMANILPILIALLWRERRRFRRYFGTVLALLIFAGLFATASRAARLGAIIGFAIIFSGIWGRRAIYYGMLVVMILAPVFLIYGSKMKIRGHDYLADPKVSTRYRREAMANGLYVWQRFPLVGVGYERMVTRGYGYKTLDPHNAFLYVAAEEGILGLYILLVGIIIYFRQSLRIFFAARRKNKHDLSLHAVAAIAATAAALVTKLFFISGAYLLQWQIAVLYNIGVVRWAEADLPDYRCRFDYRDLIIAAPAIALVLGVFYMIINISFSFP